MTQVAIFIFCDALGYEIVKEYGSFKDLFPFCEPLGMQFGYSSGAVPTILCGQPPQKHGHFSFFYYDREKRSPFRFFRWIHRFLKPDFVFLNHRVRNRLSRYLGRWLGYTGYFNLYQVPFSRLPYFDYCEKKDIFAEHGLAPYPNLRDLFQKYGLHYHMSDWHCSDAENIAAAANSLATGEPEVVFLYTAGVDGMLHFHVSDPERVKEHLAALHDQLKTLLDTANSHYDQVKCFLFSDHGMTSFAGQADLKRMVESLPYRFGTDYVAAYDSTMLRLWFLNEDCRAPILDCVKDQKGHWLSDEEICKWGIDFPNHQYGDAIFLMDPGWQIVPCDMGNKPIPGMHGYSPEDRNSTACFLSTSPLTDYPADLTEIFAFIRTQLESMRRHDGE